MVTVRGAEGGERRGGKQATAMEEAEQYVARQWTLGEAVDDAEVQLSWSRRSQQSGRSCVFSLPPPPSCPHLLFHLTSLSDSTLPVWLMILLPYPSFSHDEAIAL